MLSSSTSTSVAYTPANVIDSAANDPDGRRRTTFSQTNTHAASDSSLPARSASRNASRSATTMTGDAGRAH